LQRFGKPFGALTATQQDAVLEQMEAGKLDLGEVETVALFELILQNTREGYLSDPMYGGNKDMAGWKLVGFPGARYDFRDVVGKRNQDLRIIPVSMIERSA
jgi:gluconate 2-dehydrogenase gamma chain